MLEIKDIEKLAKLARIELTQEEKEKLLKEVDPILGYVAQLKEIVANVGLPGQGEENHEKSADLVARKAGELRNVMRGDENPTETGKNTKNIVDDMPTSQDNYLKVEKIL